MKPDQICEYCGENFSDFRRLDSKFCSNACRQAAYRKRKPKTVTFAGKRNRGFIK